MTATQPAQSVLDDAREIAEQQDEADLKSLLEAFGDRSFGPVILLLSLIAMSPIGGIPLVPSIIGVTIILFSVQLLLGRNHPWMPSALHSLGISSDKLDTFLDKNGKYIKSVDQIFEPRLEALTSKPAKLFCAILVTVLAGLMVPLEIIPFAVAIPALAIATLSAALMARDGLIMALGFVGASAVLSFAAFVLL